MLSLPPCALAQFNESHRQRERTRVSRRQLADERPDGGGFGGVVPQTVRADQRPSRARLTVRRAGTREKSGLSRPSHLVIACACGPFSASSRGTPMAIRICATESSMLSSAGILARATIRNPVDPAVADIAEHHDVALDDGRGERAGSGVVAARRRAFDHGGIGCCGRLDHSIRDRCHSAGRRAEPRRPVRGQRRRGQSRAAARLAMSESSEVDTPSQTTSTAREPGVLLSRDRRRIFVAVMSYAAVATGGDPGRRSLCVVVPLRRRLGAAGLAITVCPNRRRRNWRTGEQQRQRLSSALVWTDRVMSIGAAISSGSVSRPRWSLGVRRAAARLTERLLSSDLGTTVRAAQAAVRLARWQPETLQPGADCVRCSVIVGSTFARRSPCRPMRSGAPASVSIPAS